MRIPVLLIASLCLLVGCKFESAHTTTTTVSIEGWRDNATRSQVRDGIGDFDCIKSSSGHCHFLLFVEQCHATPDAPTDAPIDAATHATRTRCSARPVQAFTLAAGATKHLVDLPSKMKQCVSHDAAPIAPACLDARG